METACESGPWDYSANVVRTLAAAVLMVLVTAAQAHAAGSCATPVFAGTGKTIVATPATLTAAVASAAAGDTVLLKDGVYSRATVTLTKPIRLMAEHPFGALFVGGPTPRFANDVGLGPHANVAITIRASGAAVEGLDLRYYEIAVEVAGVANALVQGNRIESVYNAGVFVWDAIATEIRCNEILDPYLAQDPVATVSSGSALINAQSDYGVMVFGTRDTRVEHNYFFGVFNQTVSFKEGNWNPYAGFNTFEGSALTALFFGQNRPHNGPYAFTGLPIDSDRGRLVAEDNVFREVYAPRNGVNVVYYLRSPIRVWHVNGDTTLRDNVVEEAQQGFLLECRAGPQAGCDAGTTTIAGNTIGGEVRDLAGVLQRVNATAGVLVFSGLRAAATIQGNAFALLPAAIGPFSDGVIGLWPYRASANRVITTAPTGANLALRRATPATDPDLSYAKAF
jgi:hypothetical protein